MIIIWIKTYHYNDVIMDSIASQITSLTIVYSAVYSGADRRKHQSSALLAFVWGNSPGTGEFPAQMASNAENVSIWWCHHVIIWIYGSFAEFEMLWNFLARILPVCLWCIVQIMNSLSPSDVIWCLQWLRKWSFQCQAITWTNADL